MTNTNYVSVAVKPEEQRFENVAVGILRAFGLGR